jgi:hypothetical protein
VQDILRGLFFCSIAQSAPEPDKIIPFSRSLSTQPGEKAPNGLAAKTEPAFGATRQRLRIPRSSSL